MAHVLCSDPALHLPQSCASQGCTQPVIGYDRYQGENQGCATFPFIVVSLAMSFLLLMKCQWK